MFTRIKFDVYPPANKPETKMVFSTNPLSLSVPEIEFESWLRDSGYLEILDQRTTDLHRLSTTQPSSDSSADPAAATTSRSPNGVQILRQLFSHICTILSLFTFNPFSKVATSDFSGDTPPWTLAFVGSIDSYSFPSSPSQARLRVHENLKRFARNYACLLLLFFACSLYQLPVALFGLISCLALWDVFKFGGDKWGLDQYPLTRQTLIHFAQCATAVILFMSNVQLAVFCSMSVSYAAIILHASFRKLTPAKQHAVSSGQKRASRR